MSYKGSMEFPLWKHKASKITLSLMFHKGFVKNIPYKKGIQGEATEIKGQLEEQLAKANTVQENVATLDAPFEELVQYKLNFRAKYTAADVKEEVQQAVATINHLITSNETEITEQAQNARIAAYTEKADAYMEEASKFDAQINDVKGELEEKRTALFAIEKEVNAKIEALAELTPISEELEKDELHLEITNTPSSVAEFYNNLIQHIQTLVKGRNSRFNNGSIQGNCKRQPNP